MVPMVLMVPISPDGPDGPDGPLLATLVPQLFAGWRDVDLVLNDDPGATSASTWLFKGEMS
jgi:hypothetical protein